MSQKSAERRAQNSAQEYLITDMITWRLRLQVITRPFTAPTAHRPSTVGSGRWAGRLRGYQLFARRPLPIRDSHSMRVACMIFGAPSLDLFHWFYRPIYVGIVLKDSNDDGQKSTRRKAAAKIYHSPCFVISPSLS